MIISKQTTHVLGFGVISLYIEIYYQSYRKTFKSHENESGYDLSYPYDMTYISIYYIYAYVFFCSHLACILHTKFSEKNVYVGTY